MKRPTPCCPDDRLRLHPKSVSGSASEPTRSRRRDRGARPRTLKFPLLMSVRYSMACSLSRSAPSQIRNPKSLIGQTVVQLQISDLGFEMQDSSDFKFPSHRPSVVNYEKFCTIGFP